MGVNQDPEPFVDTIPVNFFRSILYVKNLGKRYNIPIVWARNRFGFYSPESAREKLIALRDQDSK